LSTIKGIPLVKAVGNSFLSGHTAQHCDNFVGALYSPYSSVVDVLKKCAVHPY
jgi:hypothetical protein